MMFTYNSNILIHATIVTMHVARIFDEELGLTSHGSTTLFENNFNVKYIFTKMSL